MKYFVEYTFKSTIDAVYWLPLIYEAVDSKAAAEIGKSIKNALNENGLKCLQSSVPQPYISELNSEMIDEWIANNKKGRVSRMIFHTHWVFNDLDPNTELSMTENLNLIEYNGIPNGTLIASTIGSGSWLVTTLKIPIYNDVKEFILLNIVTPV